MRHYLLVAAVGIEIRSACCFWTTGGIERAAMVNMSIACVYAIEIQTVMPGSYGQNHAVCHYHA